jgi:hypothetical protein
MRRSAALAALLAVPAGAAATEPVLPLDQVRAGMVGEARTVVQGTEITTFPVRVIDVQRDPGVPGGSLILIRAEGPLMERTGGIAEGMSGSPVYVTGADGVARVIGAIAYGTGDEGNVLGGITPIEQMIDPTRGRLANARPRAARPVVRVADRAAAVAREGRDAGVRALYPLARWTASGLRPRVAAGLRQELAPRGIRLDAVPGRGERPAQPLVPGASLSVLLVGGDATLGAIGTVTWVDGAKVLGFGHPFLGVGRTRLLMGDGYVFQTIPARQEAGSYKLAEAGRLQGTVVADRVDGVVGRIGTPAGIRMTGTARDLGRGTRVMDALQSEPLARATNGLAAGTLEVRIRIDAPGLPTPVRYENRYAAAADVVPVAEGALRRLAGVLMTNGLDPVTPSRIRVDQVLDPEVRAARIVSARVSPARARAGSAARVILTLQPWQAPRRQVALRVRIPAGLDPGPHAIRVVPHALGGFSSSAPDISEQVGAGTTPGAARTADLAGRVEALAARGGGSRQARLLRGLADATDDRHDAVRVLAPGADEADREDGRVLRVPYVVYAGRAVARLTVTP